MLQSLTAGFILSNNNYVVLQGLVLVYVTVVLVVMARQFSFLSDREDMEKMMVVNSEDNVPTVGFALIEFPKLSDGGAISHELGSLFCREDL